MDDCGLDYFGAEDAKGSGGFVDLLKKEGPVLLADAAEELKKGVAAKGTKVDDKTKGKAPSSGGSGDNWFAKPVLGPIPGGGVLALGAVLAAALGFGVYKIVH